MSRQVKGKILLKLVDSGKVVFLPGLGEFVEGRVGARHVGCVVLVVVQLEQTSRVVRLEGRVVVGKLGKAVVLHHRPPNLTT
jgi:hypothetical protein